MQVQSLDVFATGATAVSLCDTSSGPARPAGAAMAAIPPVCGETFPLQWHLVTACCPMPFLFQSQTPIPVPGRGITCTKAPHALAALVQATTADNSIPAAIQSRRPFIHVLLQPLCTTPTCCLPVVLWVALKHHAIPALPHACCCHRLGGPAAAYQGGSVRWWHSCDSTPVTWG